MPWDTLLTLFAIASASTWTPGPNNALLAASGANFGFRRTVPHAQGVTWGFPLMFFAIALGLGEIFQREPLVAEVLRWLGAAILVWFAWRIATAGRAGAGTRRGRPFTFVEAAAFQWINPKAWAMCIAVSTQFVTGSAPVREALICAAAYALAGGLSSHAWAGFGASLQRVLLVPGRLRLFNLTMGALLLGFVVLLIADRG
ncbi:MAG: LysE family translocator [Pseudomonadota bacterium]